MELIANKRKLFKTYRVCFVIVYIAICSSYVSGEDNSTSVSAVATPTLCGVHEFNLDGKRCCQKCPHGFGAVQSCGNDTDTQCTPCTHGVTFSSSSSHEENCKSCRPCGNNARIKRGCNVTHDTECECDRDHFWDSKKETCTPCDLCSHGWGASRPCTPQHNTVCRKCAEKTFSSVLSSSLGCIVCSMCRDDQEVLQQCMNIQDTVCIDKNIGLLHNRKSTSKPISSLSDMDTEEYGGRSIYPVYCAILGAVVLGLLIYVVHKHWRLRTHGQKVSSSSAATVPLTDTEASPCFTKRTPDGDSKILLPPDVYRHVNTISMDTRFREVSSSSRREIEVMLNSNRDAVSDWKALGRELGYPSSRIAAFEQKALEKKTNPARQLFSDWSKAENANLHVLIRALRNIGRYDIIRVFFPPHEWTTHHKLKGEIV